MGAPTGQRGGAGTLKGPPAVHVISDVTVVGGPRQNGPPSAAHTTRVLRHGVGEVAAPTRSSKDIETLESKRVSESDIELLARRAAGNTANYARLHPDPMREWHGIERGNRAGVALFSIFVNLLMLTMPLYL